MGPAADGTEKHGRRTGMGLRMAEADLRDRVRMREDWLELSVAAGLVLFAAIALHRGHGPLALLALPFLAATFWLWRKQARARFCADCRAPMRREPPPAIDHDHGTIRYVCERCGRRSDSGVQSGHPE